METWFQRVLLILSLGLGLSNLALGQEQEQEENDNNKTILDGIIDPDLERRKIDERKIDSENFEFGFYTGVMSVEDFGTNESYGLTLAFHVSEDWFLEASAGSTTTSLTSWEALSGNVNLIVPEDRDLTYYNLSVGLNVFQGEFFLGKRLALNMSAYVLAGAGNTEFAGDEYFTLNYGLGLRASATDWLAFRAGVNNHLFTHDIFGTEKSIQNIEPTIGLTLFF